MPTTKTNLRNVHLAVQNREEFEGSNLQGTSEHTLYTGRLPEGYLQQLQGAMNAPDFYAVYSYETPIAWYANGQWFVPAVKYSVSTSRQLSSLRIPNPTYL